MWCCIGWILFSSNECGSIIHSVGFIFFNMCKQKKMPLYFPWLARCPPFECSQTILQFVSNSFLFFHLLIFLIPSLIKATTHYIKAMHQTAKYRKNSSTNSNSTPSNPIFICISMLANTQHSFLHLFSCWFFCLNSFLLNSLDHTAVCMCQCTKQ